MLSGWNTTRAEAIQSGATVEAVLCKTLDLPTGSVKVVSGTTAQYKIVEITGLSEAEVRRRPGA